METSIIESFCIKGQDNGRLSGTGFFVKDLFDVKGYVTGGGNPDWKRSHGLAEKHAWAVEALLNAGATLKGKTVSDELACSLDGINMHYGTPLNPNFPGHIPGGSSSGSASAVAVGLCDFALGTDTAGSVRVPAAYCGVFGFRPSHGRVPIDGVLPLGPSFDTVGWFAKTPDLLQAAGEVLLARPVFRNTEIPFPSRLVIPRECLAVLDQSLMEFFLRSVETMISPFSRIETVDTGMDLEAIFHVFSTARAFEAWGLLGAWLTEHNPLMARDIKARLLSCGQTGKKEYLSAMEMKAKLVDKLEQIMDDNFLVCMPTVWNWPPLISASEAVLAANRSRNVLLTSISSVTGAPQVAIPIVHSSGKFFSLSLIAARGCDELLLSCAKQLFDHS